MYLVEIITDSDYFSSRDTFPSLEAACAFACELRREMSSEHGYVAVRVINLAFAIRR